MLAIEQSGVNLFAGTLPGFAEIRKLSKFVNCSEYNRMKFIEKLAEKDSKADALAAGVGYLIAGDSQKAFDKLSSVADSGEKCYYLAVASKNLGDFSNAIKLLDKAADKGADAIQVCIEKIKTFYQARQFDKAEELLNSCQSFANISSDYHIQKGRLLSIQGDYQAAIDEYCNAVDIDPDNDEALFRIAYACDLRGDEESAIDYYTQLVSKYPTHVNALINLSILYEDNGEFEKAHECVVKVLKSHPNHTRATLYRKDVVSSKTMIFDEEREKLRDKRNKVLEIPISDFELSVRSRNCLKKMNIVTIGDLLKISEAELLSYKNFGETSLNEIRNILESKNLRLGMALEDKGMPAEIIEPEEEESEENEILAKGVEDLELSVRARRALDRLGMRTLGQVVQKTEAELLGCKNFGVTSLTEIKERLSRFGLSLRKIE